VTGGRRPIPAGDIVLDDIDQRIILAVHAARRTTGTGPTWSELRRAVPDLPRPDISLDAFRAWWAVETNRDALEAGHLERFFEKHPNTVNADAAWARYSYRIWRARQLQTDRLPVRLRRLRWAGYLFFTTEERSLDIGRRVRAQLRRQTTVRTPA
jgi:hypothetical protein